MTRFIINTDNRPLMNSTADKPIAPIYDADTEQARKNQRQTLAGNGPLVVAS